MKCDGINLHGPRLKTLVLKNMSEQFRTGKDLDRETIFVYSINSF